jgi:transposase
MDRVVIGMDPHKRSVTIEARDVREVLRATGRFGTDTGNYRQMIKVARQRPDRIWAVVGAAGILREAALEPSVLSAGRRERRRASGTA